MGWGGVGIFCILRCPVTPLPGVLWVLWTYSAWEGLSLSNHASIGISTVYLLAVDDVCY